MQILDLLGEKPSARFGHTVTPITKTKVLLFGGATGDSGKYTITNDTFLLDMIIKKWRHLDPQGVPPCARAAHASISVDSLQMVTYGGATGGGGLAPDQLYLLDLRMGEDKALWINIPVVGSTPGKRYGHTMVFNRPFLIIFGGNTGIDPCNDVWIFNVEKAPFSWIRLDPICEIPPPRVYHAATLCGKGNANGMMIVFGGRIADQNPVNDIWGFRKHKDGRWDWIKAPILGEVIPTPRYQHSTIVIEKLMFAIGGRTNNVNDLIPMEVYDTESSEWMRFQGIERFRQCNWFFEFGLYIHGGLQQNSPNIPIDEIIKIDIIKLFEQADKLMLVQRLNNEEELKPKENNAIKYGPGTKFYTTSINPSKKSPLVLPNSSEKNIRLAQKAFIGSSCVNSEEPNNMIRKLSILKLQDESRKLNLNNNPILTNSVIQNNNMSNLTEELCNYFLERLLGVPNNEIRIDLNKEYVSLLCKEAHSIFEREKSLLKIRSPLKIFGNLHGKLNDLLKLFEHFGTPYDYSPNGDIDGFSYLFLGDYVDFGSQSIELLCLLFTLKIKFPDSIFLLRGHHEDLAINKLFGFGEECIERYNESLEDNSSIFKKINKIFEYLPLAALIDNKILAVHGGIGPNLRNISDIELLERPIEISHNPGSIYEKVVLEILLSDPVIEGDLNKDQDNKYRNYFNEENSIKFGKERLDNFLKKNNLKYIIRSHECVQQGFELSLDESVITVFSCLNHGKGNNAGCVLTIKKNFEIIPKILYPLEKKDFQLKKKIDFEKFVNENIKNMNDNPKNIISYKGLLLNKNEIYLKMREETPPRMRKEKMEEI